MEPRRIEAAETYTHPETAETVEIPAGSTIYYNDDGEITDWSNPGITPPGELHPNHVPGYVPKFNVLGTERRVLSHITDEEHVGRGPRNTVERLTIECAEDPYTNFAGNFDEMDAYVNELIEAGLVAKREDNTLEVTEAGRVELNN